MAAEKHYLIYGKETGKQEVELLFNFSSLVMTAAEAEQTVKDLQARGVTEVELKIVDACPACGESLATDLDAGCSKDWCAHRGKIR